MKNLLGHISRNGIKWLLVLKAMVILYVLNDQFGFVTLGDRSVLAEEKKAEEPKTADKDEGKEKAKDKKDGKGETATDQDAAQDDGAVITAKPTYEDVKARLTKELYPEEETEKKDTLLERLLTLPALNKDKIKKEEIGRYLALIDRRQKLLNDRSAAMKDQEAVLRQMEQSIDAKIKKLEEEIAFFKDTQQKEKELEKERLDKLVDFYQKMPPKKSAPVFEQLDKDLVVAMWKRFPEKTTMQILSLMTPAKSVQLSEYFGRIKSTREYDVLKEINVDLQKEFAECKGDKVAP